MTRTLVFIVMLSIILGGGIGYAIGYKYGRTTERSFQRNLRTEQPEEKIPALTNQVKPSIPEGQAKIRTCPDEWIMNQMPMVGTPSQSRNYFILDEQRREMSEFDLPWVEVNCNLEPQVVQ